jgi:molybdate transport system substrate-binding protein
MSAKPISFLSAMAVVLSFALTLWGSASFGAEQELTIAAASDLSFAFKELVAEFEKKTGTKVKLSLGSSGNFFSQIQNGAPFDAYFSADIRYPQKLEESGHAVSGTLYRYAVGRIVVWAPKSSRFPVEQGGIEVLLDPSIHKIAIANPKHAPYGRAAVSTMEHFKIYDRVKDKLVLGENISQTAQYVESGASDIGIIALALALAPSMKSAGKYWEIPADAHPPIEQGAVILKHGRNPEAAKSFFEFIKSDQGRDIMTRFGFVLPDSLNGSR